MLYEISIPLNIAYFFSICFIILLVIFLLINCKIEHCIVS